MIEMAVVVGGVVVGGVVVDGVLVRVMALPKSCERRTER